MAAYKDLLWSHGIIRKKVEMSDATRYSEKSRIKKKQFAIFLTTSVINDEADWLSFDEKPWKS